VRATENAWSRRHTDYFRIKHINSWPVWKICHLTHAYDKLVTVQTSSATRDLMLIQQHKLYWISNRSGVAEFLCTVTRISDNGKLLQQKFVLVIPTILCNYANYYLRERTSGTGPASAVQRISPVLRRRPLLRCRKCRLRGLQDKLPLPPAILQSPSIEHMTATSPLLACVCRQPKRNED